MAGQRVLERPRGFSLYRQARARHNERPRMFFRESAALNQSTDVLEPPKPDSH